MSPCVDVCTRHMANTCACVRTCVPCVRMWAQVGASGCECNYWVKHSFRIYTLFIYLSDRIYFCHVELSF